MPTDTVYGVAAHAGVAGAEEKIYLAKGRERGKPIPLLAAGIDDAERYGAELDAVEKKLAVKFWPGPLTLVLRVGDRTEGFRVPDHKVSIDLIKATGGVLRVTSANLSGDPPALTAGDAVRSLGPFVEIVLDAGHVSGGTPSTVAKVENGRIIVLREGMIGRAELMASC